MTDQTFNLMTYAKLKRYRTRNLNDGEKCPPSCLSRTERTTNPAYRNSNSCGAVVGKNGHLTEEDGEIGITLFYESTKGINSATRRIEAADGKVTMVGDTELAGWLPTESIEEALKLIRVSRLHAPQKLNWPHTESANSS